MPDPDVRRSAGLPAFWLGFAFAGFFDGILLHQVLQWHHLLSNLAGEPFNDIRVQILADGYFHVLMYVVLAFAIWLTVGRRAALARSGAARHYLKHLLIGFGAWQVVDVVLFHWILGIHNVRVDVQQPLLWDLGWLFVFGALPIGAAMLLRGGDKGGSAGGAAALCIALTVFAGAWAARPQAAGGVRTIVFAPWAENGAVFAAVMSNADALVWADLAADVYVVKGLDPHAAQALYRNGAVFISDRGFPPGCFSAFSSPPAPS